MSGIITLGIGSPANMDAFVTTGLNVGVDIPVTPAIGGIFHRPTRRVFKDVDEEDEELLFLWWMMQ